MTHGKILWWTCLTCLGALLAGCQAADDVPDVPSTTAGVATPAVSTASATSLPEVAADDVSESAAAPTTKTVAEFMPPFPERTELFEPPKRANSTTRRDEEHGDTVELKGFINVDEPRVVLSIDGVVSPIGEGGEKYGVQVISIQPPSVVLQRGRSRWTATLE